jgi:vacuolar-type H+-ATPase subunit D/Vma8
MAGVAEFEVGRINQVIHKMSVIRDETVQRLQQVIQWLEEAKTKVGNIYIMPLKDGSDKERVEGAKDVIHIMDVLFDTMQLITFAADELGKSADMHKAWFTLYPTRQRMVEYVRANDQV